MSIGLVELLIAALVVALLLIWRLWPKQQRGDLTAPPPGLQSDVQMARPDERPRMSQPDTAGLSTDDLSRGARRGTVKHESDYSEEDLMMRDVRAALHRGSVSEAVERVRRTRNIGEEEALDFLETIGLPK
ncbi:hypothetical protein SAMN02745824_3071 [Parasphingorhabdus marina DSM 22363]|uniref:Uncharacterized protein n=1 Tax=Parasphingorhabdus marina DSM 22363 TaxID=1123272 RepID=A0A1N6H010_9SPHN|nr:hypothetical protein [Parasphingorhabdus marina]SIO13099.1 hypothetical protein SAMN02745824_3071 [Parasphingorhabdus marina DSM 22363]